MDNFKITSRLKLLSVISLTKEDVFCISSFNTFEINRRTETAKTGYFTGVEKRKRYPPREKMQAVFYFLPG